MTHPDYLEGHLIQLQQLMPAHLYALEKIATDTRIWQHLPIAGWQKDTFWRWAYDALALQMQEKAFVFSVFDNKTGKIVGTTRFQDMDAAHQKTDIGWTWYDPSVWGRGFNFEAKNLMLTHAFEAWKVHRVGFKVDERNLRSQAALEKIGASQEGFIRKHLIRPDGSHRHSFLYGMTDDDWFSTAKQSLQNLVVEAIINQKVPKRSRENEDLMAV